LEEQEKPREGEDRSLVDGTGLDMVPDTEEERGDEQEQQKEEEDSRSRNPKRKACFSSAPMITRASASMLSTEKWKEEGVEYCCTLSSPLPATHRQGATTNNPASVKNISKQGIIPGSP